MAQGQGQVEKMVEKAREGRAEGAGKAAKFNGITYYDSKGGKSGSGKGVQQQKGTYFKGKKPKTGKGHVSGWLGKGGMGWGLGWQW